MHKNIHSLFCTVAIFACSVEVSGCADANDAETTLRISQVRCPSGFLPGESPRCNGEAVQAGTYDFRIDRSKQKVLGKVVEQDPKNESVSLFELKNCKVWDPYNWTCEEWNSAYTDLREMRNGKYKHDFLGTIGAPGDTHYTGKVQAVGGWVNKVKDFIVRR